MKPTCLFSLWLAAVALLAAPPTSHALEPTVTKLHGRATTPQVENNFGSGVAVSDAYLLVGDPFNDDAGLNVGAAHLYDARTGRYLRKLLPTPDLNNNDFGWSVALCGNLAVVGMPAFDTNNDGAVFGFDTRTGKLLWRIPPVAAGEAFGDCVAVNGKTLVVGALFATEGGHSKSGLAYVYDMSAPGIPVLKFTLGQGANAADNDFFAGHVALSGNLAVLGSFNGTGAQLHDTSTGQLLKRWTGTAGFSRSIALDAGRVVMGDEANEQIRVFDAVSGAEAVYSPVAAPGLYWDQSLSVSGNLALVGCAAFSPPQGAVAGAARLFDLTTGTELRVFTAPDGAAGDSFGFATALCGNRALIGAQFDDDLGNDSGSAYYFRDIAGPLPLRTLAQTRDFAPGVVEGDFKAFGDAVINSEGESAFFATLMGSGAGRGTAASGVWSDLTSSVQLISRGGTDLGGGLLQNATGRPIFNRPSDSVFLGSVKGTGVNGGNDSALFRSSNGGAPNIVLREGGTHATADGAVFDRFLDVAQSHTGANGDLAVAFQYKRGPGGVGAGSDSGVLGVNHDGTIVGTVFDENHNEVATMPGTFWGQFAPRVAKVNDYMVATAFLQGAGVTPADNQASFGVLPGAGDEILAIRKGDPLAGGTISSIVGEAIDFAATPVYRVILKGVSSRENEVLRWGLFVNAVVWKKGDSPNTFDPTFAAAVKQVRLLKYWPVDGSRVIYLAKLAGPGVNGNNDCALFLWENGATPQILLREGDYAPGCDCPKVGVIQRVDVEPVNGRYVVLTSLTGSSAANQALFTGDASAGNSTDRKALRLPTLQLRKGTGYQAPTGTTTKVLSMTFANTTDAAGTGAKGGPQVIDSNGRVTMCVQFTDKAKHLVTGVP